MDNTMFQKVKDPSFNDWEKVETLSESELFGTVKSTSPEYVIGDDNPIPQATPETPVMQPVQGAIQPLNIGGFLPPELAVELMDTLGASGGMIALAAMKIKVPKSELQASSKEKQTLVPVMEQALKSINIQITNPWEALAYAFVAVYGSKVAVAAASNMLNPDKKSKEKEYVIGDEQPDGAKSRYTKKTNNPRMGRPKKS